MSSLQEQDFMEVEQQTMASYNQSYIIFKESKADLIDLLQESFLDMATKLWQDELITDQLYNEMSRKSLSYTEYERTRVMLQTIYSKLKTAHAASITKGLIIVLRKDQAWYAMADEIGKCVCIYICTHYMHIHYYYIIIYI